MLKLGPKTISECLREALEAIEEVTKRKSQPEKVFYITVHHITFPVQDNNHVDLADVIQRGADSLLHDRIERTRSGGYIVRRGINPFIDEGPRARLYHRLQTEALKARGIISEA